MTQIKQPSGRPSAFNTGGTQGEGRDARQVLMDAKPRCGGHPREGATATWRKTFGGDLLSHPVTRAVPSALTGLASGVGMEPGVSPSLWPPQHCRVVDPGPPDPIVSREPHSRRDHQYELWQGIGLLILV